MKMKTSALALAAVLALSSLMACNAQAQDNKDNETTVATKSAGTVTSLTEATFYEKVYDLRNTERLEFKGDRPVVVDFYATWCGPCKQMAPILEEMAQEFAGQVDVYKVDIDQNRNLAGMIGIQSIPTFLFINAEGEPKLTVGGMEKAQFKKLFKEIVTKETK